MSKHLGDFDTSAVIYGKFSTFRPSTGAAFTLGGTPALSVYKDNSITQSTTGVTLTADFDSVTGLNHFAIDTSTDGTFYAAGSFFDIVITTGTVDSVSVVGSVVGSFTIRKTSTLKPTAAGRTLDVSATGEADANTVQWLGTACATPTVAGVPEVDLTHVAGATTNVAALATNVDAILTDTGTTLDTKLNNIQGATFDTATDSLEALRNRGDASWITATGFSTHAAADVWSVATRAITDKDGFRLSATGVGDILTSALTESYAADGATFTLAQGLYMIWSALGEFAISGTTITAKKLDGITTSMTFTLNDGTNPTSRTRAT